VKTGYPSFPDAECEKSRAGGLHHLEVKKAKDRILTEVLVF